MSTANALRHLSRTVTLTNESFTVPLWQVVGNLESLSLKLDEDLRYRWNGRAVRENACDAITEQVEATFAEVRKTASPLKANRYKVHLRIATRTIIAAAKGGKLRRLRVDRPVQHPFAIRALLPHWVGVDAFDMYGGAWQGAAAALRPLLAHASTWLHATPASGARSDRLLTPSDVQGLQAYCEAERMPVAKRGVDMQHVQRYLPWLAEDEELSGKVVEAWNAVVDRGDVDAVQCHCEKCRLQRGEKDLDRSRWFA